MILETLELPLNQIKILRLLGPAATIVLRRLMISGREEPVKLVAKVVAFGFQDALGQNFG